MLKDLLTREISGLAVTLFWNDASRHDPTIPPLMVSVSAEGLPSFKASADNSTDALNIFHHPYASLDSLRANGRLVR